MQHLPNTLRRTTLFLGAALAIAYLAGCGHTTYVGSGPGAPRPDTYVELEPNDTPFLADFVTVVDPSTFLVVDGHVEAIGIDVVDHIEFEADQPVEIEFFLEAFGPFGDVDVSIYDPIADVVLATYASAGSFESGTIVVHEPGRPFQFVIEAFDEDSAWSLELVGYEHVCGCAAATDGASEPGDGAAGLELADEDGDEGDAALPPIQILVGP